MQNQNLKDLLPVSPLQYYILFVLVGHTLHGYQIMQKVATMMDKVTPTATLYRVLRRMLKEGVLEIDNSPKSDSDDPRRRYYRLTDFGQRVFEAQTDQYRALIKQADACLRKGEAGNGPALI